VAPRDVRRLPQRFEFNYLDERGWSRLQLSPAGRGRWQVLAPDEEKDRAERLRRELNEDPRWASWLNKAAAVSGPAQAAKEGAALTALLNQVSRGAESKPSSIEAALAEAAGLPQPALTLARVVLWLSAEQPLRALEAWSELGETDAGFTSNLVGTMVDHLAGRCASVITRTARLSQLFRDPDDARAAAEVANVSGDLRTAAMLWKTAAMDAAHDSRRYLSTMGIALTAAEKSKQRDVAAMLAAHMEEHLKAPEHQLEVARAHTVAGNFATAESILRPLLDLPAVARSAALQLGSLHLWRSDPVEARQLVSHWADSDADCGVVWAASEGLLGRSEIALERLNGILSEDPRHALARMWRGRLLCDVESRPETFRSVWEKLRRLLGRVSAPQSSAHEMPSGSAREDVSQAGSGDTIPRQVWRGLTEDESYLLGHQTGFIVHANVQVVLGECRSWPTTGPEARALVREAAQRLGGNMTRTPTVVDARGDLTWLDTVTARRRAEQLIFSVTRRPMDDVLAEFEQLQASEPSIPFYQTYAAELWMWRGDYERSHELFLAVWNETRTRWGYVGAGATAHLMGNHDRALELWDDGATDWEWLDGEATYTYRGELRRLRGDTAGGRSDLMISLGVQPLRVGARINLALIELDEGNPDAALAELAIIESHVPGFAWVARGGLDPAMKSAERLRAYLESLLSLMRGNRSSTVYSMVDPQGHFRATPARGTAEVSRRLAARVAGVLADDIVAISPG
jgi:tetratricopeptide (TPR) repeat protein